MALTTTRQRAKNPSILSEILKTVRELEAQRREPTFNTILNELAAKRVLVFHRSFRKYLDLLVFAKFLAVNYEETTQPNIRPKQVYHSVSEQSQATIEAGEKALLLHGLNWDIPSPKSLNVETDLQGLARATVSGKKVYASLEDAIVQSFKKLAGRAPELVVFATALIATQKVDFNYLLSRAKKEGVEREIIAILVQIDKAFASPNPGVEDILTLYKLRSGYTHLRRPLLKSIQSQVINIENLPKDIVSANEVVEYAGKQLGLKG